MDGGYLGELTGAATIATSACMPEGPECHATARRIRRHLLGKTNAILNGIQFIEGRYKTHGVPECLTSLLLDNGSMHTPKTVNAVGCRGKLIYILFEDSTALLSTLGLTGKWQKRHGKHCGIRLDFAKPVSPLWFADQLHYGTLSYVSADAFRKKFLSIGPDVTLGRESFTFDMWQSITTTCRGWELAKLLMSQAKMSGIGNYLKAEILFEAAVSPHQTISSLSSEELRTLYDAIVNVSIAWYHFRSGQGPRPTLKVYGRKTTPSGDMVIRTRTLDGRISHWCPVRQDRAFAARLVS